MASIAFVLLLICAALGVAACTGRRFELAAPAAALLIILILTAFGLVGLLRAGFIAVLVLCAAGLGVFLFALLRAKPGLFGGRTRDALLRSVFTPGFAAFVVFSAVLLVLTRRQVLSEWDEFSHWGLAAKNLFLLDAFWGADGATVVFQTYPPSLSLLPYLLFRLAGRYSEGALYFANGLFCLLLLLPVLAHTEWKKPVSALLLSVFCLLLPLILFPNHFISVYADSAIALLLGGLLLTACTGPDDTVQGVFLGLGASVLVLAKPTGAVFWLLFLLAVLAFRILPRGAARPPLRVWLPAVLLPVLFGAGWLCYVRVTGAATDPVIAAFTEPGGRLYSASLPPYLRDVVISFLIRFVRPVGAGALPVSPLMWAAAFAVLTALLRREAGAEAERRFRAGAAVSVLFLVYAGLLLLSYLFAFSEYDAQRLSSFDRYIATYELAALVFFAGLFARPAANRQPVAALFLAAALLPVFPLSESVSALAKPGERAEARAVYAPCAEQLSTLDPASDRVCIVSTGSDALDQYVLRYLAAPVPATFAFSWSLGPSQSDYDQWSLMIEPEDWLKEAAGSGCTHVLVRNAGSAFIELYAPVFRGAPASDTLWRIAQEPDGALCLIPVSE